MGMTPIPERPALDGCTVAGTTAIPGGGAVGEPIGAVFRPIPVSGNVVVPHHGTGTVGDLLHPEPTVSGTVGDLLHPTPTVNWSIKFLIVHPKPPVEGRLGELFDTPLFFPSFQQSVSAMQSWFLSQTGSRLRIQPDIGIVQVNETDDQIAAHGDKVRDRIEVLLREMGLIHAFTLYAVWYDGVSHHACGGGAWPHGGTTPPNAQVPGHVAALYLQGAFDNVNCAADAFSPDGETPAINEFKMLHEILHTMGIVSPAAPHHVRRGHVSDDEHDLMYAGDRIWRPSVIDAGHDDYFQTGRDDIIDLSRSVWLDPTPPNAQPPPGWDTPVG
jgi:hypothetical protein